MNMAMQLVLKFVVDSSSTISLRKYVWQVNQTLMQEGVSASGFHSVVKHT